jgi:hypothetical protein
MINVQCLRADASRKTEGPEGGGSFLVGLRLGPSLLARKR